jgi:outer membrane receptor protein involved in Fe transport
MDKEEWNVSLDTTLEEDSTETGFWIEGDTAIGSRLELSAGVRYVDHEYDDNEEEINQLLDGARDIWLTLPEPEGSKWVPRGALTWKATDDLQLRFTAGKGFRAPPPAFDKVCCGRQYRGNRGVSLERSESAGFEVLYQPGPRWRVGLSAFRTDFDNFILNMATDSDRGTHTYQNVNIADSRNTSITVDGRFQAPRWLTTSLSYSWLDPENRAPDEGITALIDRGGAPVEETFYYEEIPYTTDARGALGLTFSLPLRFTVILGAQYTGATWIQRFNQAGVDPDLSETEDFWVVNTRVSRDFRNGLQLYAGVDNVTDYVQAGGCTYGEAQADSELVGCLGDPSYDYNWGPLRGIYYYGGIGYSFD